MNGQKNNNIAIGVPTLNRPNDINLFLKCVSESSYYPNTIFILDQSDNNYTKKIIDSWKILKEKINIVYTHSEKKSATHARNLIFEQANSDYLLLMDDDVLFDKHFLYNVKNKLIKGIECVNVNVVESRDYGEVFASYLEYILQSEKINSYRRSMGLAEKFINFLYKVSFNSCYKMNTMKLNFIGKVIADYNSSADYVGEVLSGIMVLSNNIYKNYYFDDYFSGYTLLEDVEFSMQLKNNFDVYVFSDIRVYHNKDISHISREPLSLVIKKHYHNSLYIFKKHAECGSKNNTAFVYSRFVFTLVQSLKALGRGRISVFILHWKQFILTTRSVIESS